MLKRIATPLADAVANALLTDRHRVASANANANANPQLLRIVPGPQVMGQYAHRVIGSKVLLGDGREVPGVFKVEIIGEANVDHGGGLWTAIIHCHVQAPAVSTLGTVRTAGAAVPRWKRTIVRWLGLTFAPPADLP